MHQPVAPGHLQVIPRATIDAVAEQRQRVAGLHPVVVRQVGRLVAGQQRQGVGIGEAHERQLHLGPQRVAAGPKHGVRNVERGQAAKKQETAPAQLHVGRAVQRALVGKDGAAQGRDFVAHFDGGAVDTAGAVEHEREADLALAGIVEAGRIAGAAGRVGRVVGVLALVRKRLRVEKYRIRTAAGSLEGRVGVGLQGKFDQRHNTNR